MRESLSGLYRLISNEDTDSDMWSVLKDFIEKIFLVPCLPEGMLSLVSSTCNYNQKNPKG
jgi:hypothetical protein